MVKERKTGGDQTHRVRAGDFTHYSVELYIASDEHRGYFFLAEDSDHCWYWANAHSADADPRQARFYGPCDSRGAAIAAGEHSIDRRA